LRKVRAEPKPAVVGWRVEPGILSPRPALEPPVLRRGVDERDRGAVVGVGVGVGVCPHTPEVRARAVGVRKEVGTVTRFGRREEGRGEVERGEDEGLRRVDCNVCVVRRHPREDGGCLRECVIVVLELVLPAWQPARLFEHAPSGAALADDATHRRFAPPNELDLEDVDADEDDLEAIMGRQKKVGKDGKPIPEEKPVFPPLAYAPYFPRDYSPRWHIFLSDSKQGKIAVPPFTFTSFNKPILDENNKPTFNMQTLKISFQAPPQPGNYTFAMHLICDSYVGFDSKMEVTLVVDEASKADNLDSEDDISEPDEDSIAGQMAALKQGGLTGPPPKKKKRTAVEESDDGSDTEGEAADDTSETDTDTDEE